MTTALERPSNVKKFEILMYVSAAMGFLASIWALIWPPVDTAEYSGLYIATILVGVMFGAFRVLTVWLAARRRANWARITNAVFTAFSVFGLSSLFYPSSYAGDTITMLNNVVYVVMVALEVIALCFVFSKSANEWFAGKK